jgi:hypothetical protein
LQQANGGIVAGLTGFAPALLTVTLEAASTNRTTMKRIFMIISTPQNAAIRLNLSCCVHTVRFYLRVSILEKATPASPPGGKALLFISAI